MRLRVGFFLPTIHYDSIIFSKLCSCLTIQYILQSLGITNCRRQYLTSLWLQFCAPSMAQLPDPTTDLDWSGYVGSIQSHFSEQARRNPDRICVVETKSSESPERSFTYKQIYEASNVLAHYLHDAGVTNGDVVMVWAHRSVDLVISIMGTLV